MSCPKDPARLKMLWTVNHYGNSNSLRRKQFATAKGLKMFFYQKTREGCGCFRGLFGGSRRKTPGKSREIAGKMLPNREMLQILGFRAPGKANLPGTLGPHCRDLVPTFRAGCFLKSTVPAFSSFSDFNQRNQQQNAKLVRIWAHQSRESPLASGFSPHSVVAETFAMGIGSAKTDLVRFR